MKRSEVIEYIHAQRRNESHGDQSTIRRQERQEKAQNAPLAQAIKDERRDGQIHRFAWLVPRRRPHP